MNNNKKVGIITYRDIADGKGRFLQAYALYSAIKGLGYIPQIIDYFPIFDCSAMARLRRINKHLSKRALLADIDTVLKKFISPAYKRAKREQRAKNNIFMQKNISMTEQVNNFNQLQKIQKNYGAIVCGSDQIWNPYFATGKDIVYYLQFTQKCKRIAYAPSLGTNNISEVILEKIVPLINDIPYRSIREQSSARMLHDQYGLDLTHVVDPTFLMQRTWWKDLANCAINEPPYILTFFFDNSLFPRKVARALAQTHGYKIINIPEDTLFDLLLCSKKYADAGINEFVSLFRNAAFICTQSFHGVVLSLLYNRPFYVFNRGVDDMGIFTRITDLLSLVGLENRIIKNYTITNLPGLDIDYENVNSVLSYHRDRSLAFLRDALENSCNNTNL